MARSIPFYAVGPHFDWRTLDLTDTDKIRVERAVGGWWPMPLAAAGRSPMRLQLYAPGSTYPTGAVGGDVHAASFPVLEARAVRSWDLLWLPVSHDPTNPDGAITEVTVRFTDGGLEYYWNAGAGQWQPVPDATTWTSVANAQAQIGMWSAAGAPGADITRWGLRLRLRSEKNTITPAAFGFALGYTVDAGVKLQSRGTVAHPVSLGWVEAALWRDVIPFLRALPYRWWGQKRLEIGDTVLGVQDSIGELSIPIGAVLEVFEAGPEGETLGAAIPGTWTGEDFVFGTPITTDGLEVVYSCEVVPAVNANPQRDLVVKALPLLTIVEPRQSQAEPPDLVMVPDVAGLAWKRWQRERNVLTFDLRIDAHDAAVADHIVETIRDRLDASGGAVVTSVATGHRYGLRISTPARAGSDFGMPSRIMTLSAFPIPDFRPLADVPMVLPADGVIVSVSGDAAVAE